MSQEKMVLSDIELSVLDEKWYHMEHRFFDVCDRLDEEYLGEFKFECFRVAMDCQEVEKRYPIYSNLQMRGSNLSEPQILADFNTMTSAYGLGINLIKEKLKAYS